MKRSIAIAISVFAGVLAILAGRQAFAQATIPMPVAPAPGNADYVVAQGPSVPELVDSVKALQAKGYSCQGGMATPISQNGSGWVYQAMVR